MHTRCCASSINAMRTDGTLPDARNPRRQSRQHSTHLCVFTYVRVRGAREHRLNFMICDTRACALWVLVSFASTNLPFDFLFRIASFFIFSISVQIGTNELTGYVGTPSKWPMSAAINATPMWLRSTRGNWVVVVVFVVVFVVSSTIAVFRTKPGRIGRSVSFWFCVFVCVSKHI